MTTGGHAQSLAIALRQAGASEVTILVVGRDLNPSINPPPTYSAPTSTHAHMTRQYAQ
jgi:hypothetical protein